MNKRKKLKNIATSYILTFSVISLPARESCIPAGESYLQFYHNLPYVTLNQDIQLYKI